MTDIVANMEALARKWHEGAYRRGPEHLPYIVHPAAVHLVDAVKAVESPDEGLGRDAEATGDFVEQGGRPLVVLDVEQVDEIPYRRRRHQEGRGDARALRLARRAAEAHPDIASIQETYAQARQAVA